MSLSKIPNEYGGIPKWQIALAVGGSLLVGVGLYYFLLKDESKKSNPKKSKEESLSEPQPLLPDDDLSDTPSLERAQAAKVTGNKFFKSGKYEEAIKCYSRALLICPSENTNDISTFYQNRAAAYEQLKNWEYVMRDCTEALELNNRYVKALQRRAKACEILNDLEQALEDLTSVCIIESFGNQSTLITVDRILKELGKQHGKEAMESRKPVMPSKYFIKSYYESFAEDPIFSSLHNGIELETENTDSSSAHNGFLKAKEHFRDERYEEIVGCCSNELSLPFSKYKNEALLLRATILILKGETKGAIKDLNELISTENVPLKITSNALVKRGTLKMQVEQVDECLQDFEKAIKLDPSNADVYHHRGQVNLLLAKIDEAISDFKKAVDLNSNFPLAVVQRCYTDYRFAHEMGDTEKVADQTKQFEAAIEKFPNCMECYILFAQVLCDQNEFSKADELYKKALEVDPDNPTTLVHQALLMLQWKGDVQESKKLLLKALEVDDKCEQAYENLATIEVQTGNLKGGAELFAKAIPLAKTEMEMAHLFSLKDAAVAQLKIVEKLGITIPNLGTL